jgi:hypothetical protein
MVRMLLTHNNFLHHKRLQNKATSHPTGGDVRTVMPCPIRTEHCVHVMYTDIAADLMIELDVTVASQVVAREMACVRACLVYDRAW